MATELLDRWKERLLVVGDLVQFFPIWEPSVPAIVTYSGPGAIADHIVTVRLLERVRGHDKNCLATRLADIRDLGREFAFPFFVLDRHRNRFVHPRSPLFVNRMSKTGTA